MQLTALYVTHQPLALSTSLSPQPLAQKQHMPRGQQQPQMPLTLQSLLGTHVRHTLRLFFAGFGQDARLWQQFVAPLVTAAQTASVNHNSDIPDVYMLSAYGQRVQEADALQQVQESLTSTGLLKVSSVINLNELQKLLAFYDQIEVVAWSFGIRAALAILGSLDLSGIKFIQAIALCGTIEAVDIAHGIEPSVYQHMCRGLCNKRLSTKVMKNFAQQMIGTSNAFFDDNSFKGNFAEESSVSIDFSRTHKAWDVPTDETVLQAYIEHYEHAVPAQLCAELYVMPYLKLPDVDPFIYQWVYVASRDMIFPPKHSYLSWQAYSIKHEAKVKVDYREIDSKHLPLGLIGELLFAPYVIQH